MNQVLENVKDKPFDYIFDTWGGNELFPHLKQILVKNGTYHTIVGDDPHSFFTGTSKSFLEHFKLASFVRLFISICFIGCRWYWMD